MGKLRQFFGFGNNPAKQTGQDDNDARLNLVAGQNPNGLHRVTSPKLDLQAMLVCTPALSIESEPLFQKLLDARTVSYSLEREFLVFIQLVKLIALKYTEYQFNGQARVELSAEYIEAKRKALLVLIDKEGLQHMFGELPEILMHEITAENLHIVTEESIVGQIESLWSTHLQTKTNDSLCLDNKKLGKIFNCYETTINAPVSFENALFELIQLVSLLNHHVDRFRFDNARPIYITSALLQQKLGRLSQLSRNINDGLLSEMIQTLLARINPANLGENLEELQALYKNNIQTQNLAQWQGDEKQKLAIKDICLILQDTLTMPICAEREICLLIQYLKLCELGIERFNYQGRIHSYISDVVLLLQLEKIQPLLQREEQQIILQQLKDILALKDPKELIKQFNQIESVFQQHLRVLDIPRLQKQQEHADLYAAELKERDVVVLLGATGAGKSTFIHWMMGSQFSLDQEDGLTLQNAHASAEIVQIGNTTESQTRDMTLVDLGLAQNLFAPSEVYLCDTPGLGDTVHQLKLQNDLLIARSLQQAKSIRLVILCSVNAYGNKGEKFLELLQFIVNLIPNFERYFEAIEFAFTGFATGVTSKRIKSDIKTWSSSRLENITVLVKQLIALLNTRYNEANPRPIHFINPTKEKPSREEFLHNVLAHTAIRDPLRAIKVFIESDCQSDLYQQLKIHAHLISSLLKRMQSNQTLENQDLLNDCHLLEIKLAELGYLNLLLPEDSEVKSTFETCYHAVVETQAILNEQANKLYKKCEVKIASLEDLQHFKSRTILIEKIQEILITPGIKMKDAELNKNLFSMKPVQDLFERLTQQLYNFVEMQGNEFFLDLSENNQQLLNTRKRQQDFIHNLCQPHNADYFLRLLNLHTAMATIFNFNNRITPAVVMADLLNQLTVSFRSAKSKSNFVIMNRIIERLVLLGVKIFPHFSLEMPDYTDAISIFKQSLVRKFCKKIQTAIISVPDIDDAILEQVHINNLTNLNKTYNRLCEDSFFKADLNKLSLNEKTIESSMSEFSDKLLTYLQSIVDQITEILADSDNMQGINMLGIFIEQFDFVFSISNSVILQKQQTKITGLQKISHFVSAFATEFKTQLALEQAIDCAIYKKIETYLTYLNNAEWITSLELRDKTTQVVSEAMTKRTVFLAVQLDGLSLELGTHEAIQKQQWILIELGYWLELDFTLPEVTKIAEMRTNFLAKLNAQLEKFVTEQTAENFTIDRLTQIAAYISVCEAIEGCSVAMVKQGMIAFFNEQLTAINRRIERNLQNIILGHPRERGEPDLNSLDSRPTGLASRRMRGNDDSVLSEEQIDCCITELQSDFQLVLNIKNQLPDYDQQTGQTFEVVSDLLAKNVEAFRDCFLACVSAAAAGVSKQLSRNSSATKIEIVNRDQLAGLIELCKKLQILDVYLPKKQQCYAELYTRYRDIFENAFFSELSAVLKPLHVKNYESVVKQVGEIQVNTPLWDTLIEQVSKHIRTLMQNLSASNKKLAASRIIDTNILQAFKNCIDELKAVQPLIDASLVDKKPLEKYNESLKQVQLTLNNWFSARLDQLEGYIDGIMFFETRIDIYRLKRRLENAAIKPEGYDSFEDMLDQKIITKIEAIKQQYKAPISNWQTNQHSLIEICIALAKVKELESESESGFNAVWQQIVDLVVTKVEEQCVTLEQDLREARLDIKAVVNVMQQISNTLHRTQMPEYGKPLVVAILDRCRTTLSALQTAIVDSKMTFASKLERIAELKQSQEQLVTLFGEFHFEIIEAWAKEELQRLETEIKAQVAKSEFPQIQLRELRLLQTALPVATYLTDAIDQALAIVTEYIYQKFQQISELLVAYETTADKTAVLKQLQIDLRYLTQMQQYLQSRNSLELPDVKEDIVRTLKAIATKLQSNVNAFDKALAELDTNNLYSTLTEAKNWNPLLVDLERFVELFDTDDSSTSPVFKELTTLIKQNNLEKLFLKLKQKFKDILVNIKQNSIGSLLNRSEGLDSKKQRYQILNNWMEFFKQETTLFSIQGKASKHNYYDEAVNFLQRYFQEIYLRAEQAFAGEAKISEYLEWTNFEKLYKELLAFSDSCFINIEINAAQNTTVTEIVYNLKNRFLKALKAEIASYTSNLKEKFDDPDYQRLLVDFIICLQLVKNHVPSFAEQIKIALASLLNEIKVQKSVRHLQSLANLLQEHVSGIGQQIINEQSCFKGIAIALRNFATKDIGVDNVLDELEISLANNSVIKLAATDKDKLKSFYERFKQYYDSLLQQYLHPDLDFENNAKTVLAPLVKQMQTLISNIRRTSDGKVIWAAVKENIPQLAAYLFAIWTLRDSKAYFEVGDDVVDKITYLKQPHPAQILGIFCMLGMLNDQPELSNHFVQILTGEGKSVVMAVSAAILALAGYKVNCVCYSDYLSERDYSDFSDMFELLAIQNFISYGTFNQLVETELGDVRKFVLQQMGLVEPSPALQHNNHNREEIILADEVDVFFNRDFYGSLYQPTLLLQHQSIRDLFMQIWQWHSRKFPTQADIKKLQEYGKCHELLGDWAFLLESALPQILKDLAEFDKPNIHPYQVKNGEIVYQYQDGSVNNQIHGYKTLWAYYHQKQLGNIPENTLNSKMGLVVSCGAFSYAEILKQKNRFKCILGVSGTLKELSEPEQVIVNNEFGVQQKTYNPSAYGPNKLEFRVKSGVKIAAARHFFYELNREISNSTVGKADSKFQRPILVFFDSLANLESAANYMRNQRVIVNQMTTTSASTKAERESELKRATTAGAITFALREYCRGRDFICSDPRVNANGGVHVIQTFLSDELSEERQAKGRTARAGQEGSYSLMLCEEELLRQDQVFRQNRPQNAAWPAINNPADEELLKQYQSLGLTSAMLTDRKNHGTVYENLNIIRTYRFGDHYQRLAIESKQAQEALHLPSMQLLAGLQQQNKAIVLAQMQYLNPKMSTSDTKNSAHVVILIDATGSMGNVIEGVKKTIGIAMRGLAKIASTAKCDPKDIQVQLATYRGYKYSAYENVLQTSNWGSAADSSNLQRFINSIQAKEGDGYEALEVGLHHVVAEVEKGIPVNRVMLIGDIGGTREDTLKENSAREFWRTKWGLLNYASFWQTETATLASQNIPVDTFYISTEHNMRDEHRTTTEYQKISTQTAGKFRVLSVDNPELAKVNILESIGDSVITGLANGDEVQRETLLDQYRENIKAFI